MSQNFVTSEHRRPKLLVLSELERVTKVAFWRDSARVPREVRRAPSAIFRCTPFDHDKPYGNCYCPYFTEHPYGRV
ncbi:MAG TPA: hypothetical protein VF786_12415, partial [Terriglobales bacterium]